MKIVIIYLLLSTTSAVVVGQEVVKPDNSQKNDRDKYLHEYTAQEQGKSKEDNDLTRRIRLEIVKDKNLSIYAKNIKVITMNGQVTLKGPVRSSEEVRTIMLKAQTIAGTSSVLNQMEIAPKIKK